MAAPKPARPPKPSSRVVLAFFIAATIGALVFLIWWVSASAPPSSSESELRRDKSFAPAKPPADTNDIPRGGALRGPADPDLLADTISLLTQATLVRVSRSTDQLEPWLAESWTSSRNNLTYLIKLRPNILWSDGQPLAADEVASAINISPSARVLGKPLAARATGPMEVEITFPGAFAPGLRLLDRVPITSAHGGLGPFVLAAGLEARPAQRTFTRNPHYWRTAPDGKALPYLDAIELDTAADPSGNLKRLLEDELDFVETELRAEDYLALKRADQEDRARLYNLGPGLATDVLWLNGTANQGAPSLGARSALRTLLANDVFRLAISTAVNRREFCDNVYLGACDPVFGPVTPGNPSWFLTDLAGAGPDPALARAMLAGLGLQDRNKDGVLDDEAGHAVRLSILVARGRASAERGALFLSKVLGEVGIGVDLTAVDAAVLADRRKKGTYDAIYGRLEPEDTDPAMNLDFWLRPNPAADWEKRLNEMMLKQATSTDRVERVQLFADVQKLYAQHMPQIFIAAPYTYVATSLRVRNAKPSGRPPALLWNADQLAIAAR
jgi:peptide/nickel transport system substrate-binding protein